MSRLIIASAASFETLELVHLLAGAAIPVTNIITGIGHTQSTITATRLQNFVRGRDVIFCCTGGVVGPFSGVTIYRASSAKLAPFDVRRGMSELLDSFDPVCQFEGLPLKLPECEALGSFGVTVASEPWPDGPVMLETLELYGVARAWLAHAKSFTAVIASTNSVGPTARKQWQENFRLAATLTADTLVGELGDLLK
jgi:hypothetical protein